MTTTLEHADGRVHITETADRRKIDVELRDDESFSPLLTCETAYSNELISLILEVKGPAWLCDEIARDEDPDYVQKHLKSEMRAHFRFDEIEGKRILDFGCGSGASTMCLARLFPESAIVGVELERDLLRVAQARRDHYRFENVEFKPSRSGTELPDDLGSFDMIVLSAVYEHLLPNERAAVLPKLWSMVNDGGILFLDQTPHRYFPLELHTTSLPLINYLPDGLTLSVARKFSKRVGKDDTWESLLRAGIRGATVGEIRKHLNGAVVLPPTMSGLRDPIDLWYETTNPLRLRSLKRIARTMLKAVHGLTGVALVPELTLAFRKQLRYSHSAAQPAGTR